MSDTEESTKMYTSDDLEKMFQGTNPEVQDIYNKLSGSICSDLTKIFDHVYIVPVPRENGMYFSDYAFNYIADLSEAETICSENEDNEDEDNEDDEEEYEGEEDNKIQPQNCNKDKIKKETKPSCDFDIIFSVYIEDDNTINLSENIVAEYSQLNIKQKQHVIEILRKHINNRWLWTGNNNEKITITYDKVKSPVELVLTDNDDYPQLSLSIDTLDNDFDRINFDDLDSIKKIRETLNKFNSVLVDDSFGYDFIEYVLFCTKVKDEQNDLLIAELIDTLNKIKNNVNNINDADIKIKSFEIKYKMNKNKKSYTYSSKKR